MVEVCVVVDFYDVFANHGDCFNKDKKNFRYHGVEGYTTLYVDPPLKEK